jgi:hypothetical protein
MSLTLKGRLGFLKHPPLNSRDAPKFRSKDNILAPLDEGGAPGIGLQQTFYRQDIVYIASLSLFLDNHHDL